ncbi:hypothetical protein [Oryzibacter oryziterrae]|uniref:hypothetical protein n=1 Tax=Oryzibacter oryziterrae TaxID=2766474 RepID=UPI001F266BE1|nr:hypothetical protein [Oryzibacter oryziterrae]
MRYCRIATAVVAVLASFQIGASHAAEEPLSLEYSVGGFTMREHAFYYGKASRAPGLLLEVDFEATDGASGKPPNARHFTVSQTSWHSFRKLLDDMKAWTWNANCTSANEDDVAWKFTVIYPDRSIDIRGYGAFPRAGGGCNLDWVKSGERRRLEAMLRKIADQ